MAYLFRLQLLGPIQVEQNGELLHGFKSHKTLALLGYLAAENRPVSRNYLISLFWPDKSEDRGRNNLSQALHNLLTLWPGCLTADRHTVQFYRPAVDWLDLSVFNELAARGEINSLAMAAECYRDEFMAGMYLDDCPEFEQWLSLEQETWRRRVIQVLRELINHYANRSDWEQALQWASRLVAIDPSDEEGHCQKMTLLARSGQRNAAMTQFEICRRFLLNDLGVEPAPETLELYEQIRSGDLIYEMPTTKQPETHSLDLSPRHAAASVSFNNIPAQSTSFVGREQELAIIDAYLANPTCRLLTIIGLGGIGKTRLAIQSAASTDKFPHGVCFIPLVSTSSTEFLVSTIADALNFPVYGWGDPQTQLIKYLSEKEMLLVMDNFEHLNSGAALLVELLQHAPHLKILVTSRERLGLPEEWVLDLPGLPFPEDPDNGQIANYSAVQLFLQRAQQVQADFWLRFLDKPAIAHICQLVEGLPLGIELAAAWTRSLSCQEIATEIEKNYNFLTTSLQNIPKRHQSVRAVFEHSWKLLSIEERCVFGSLSVFWGGFSREAAEQVVGASALLLSALMDKSLLRRTSAERYEIHELLRQYGAEKLSENPEEKKRIKDCHCQYYAELLQTQEAHLKKGEQREALEAISLEIDNVRAGWYWSVTGQREEDFEKYREGLFLTHNVQSWFQEGEAVFRQAATNLQRIREKIGPDWKRDKMMGQVLTRQGVFCASLGHYDKARVILQEGLTLFENPHIRQSSPLSLNYLGAIAWALGEYPQAKQLCQEGLTTIRQQGDRWKEALILQYLGMIALSLGEYVEAKAIALNCLAIFKEFGYRSGLAFSLNLRGIAARNLGEYNEARQLCQESLAIAREIGDRWEEALALEYLGMIANNLGEYDEAKAMAEQSLAIFRAFGYRSGIAFCLNLMGTIARNRGNYAEAKRLHQEVLQTCQELDYPLGITLASYHLGRITHLLGDPQEARRLLTESLGMAKKLAYQRGVTQSLNALGKVAYDLGEYQEAKHYFLEALETTQQIHAMPIALDILTSLANLLIHEGQTRQAIELLAIPLNHAASKKETRDKAGRLFSELARQLPGEVAIMAQTQQTNGQFDEVVTRILNEKVDQKLPLVC